MHSLEPPDVTGSTLTLGTAGSRRTVYLIDEITKLPDSAHNNVDTVTATPLANSTANNSAVQPNNSHDEQQQQSVQPPPSTVLMYNRISNVIGTIGNDASGSNSTAIDAQSADKNLPKDKKGNDESAVWYEYGCV